MEHTKLLAWCVPALRYKDACTLIPLFLILRSVWSWCVLLNPTGVRSWWNTVANATRTWSTRWARTPSASNSHPKISSYQPNINNPPPSLWVWNIPRPLRVRPALTPNSSHSTSPSIHSALFQPYSPLFRLFPRGSFRWKAQKLLWFVFFCFLNNSSRVESGGLSCTFDPSSILSQRQYNDAVATVEAIFDWLCIMQWLFFCFFFHSEVTADVKKKKKRENKNDENNIYIYGLFACHLLNTAT